MYCTIGWVPLNGYFIFSFLVSNRCMCFFFVSFVFICVLFVVSRFAFYFVIRWNDCLAGCSPSCIVFFSLWYNLLIIELTMLIQTHIVAYDSWLFDVLLVRTRMQRKRWAVLIQFRWLRLSKRHQSNCTEGGTQTGYKKKKLKVKWDSNQNL